MDIDRIRDRILEFLKSENKSSAQFAQEIGVQPSAISHIISGRNKPSLDFVMKMINCYPALSVEWVLFGKGSMYADRALSDLSGSAPLITGDEIDLFSVNTDQPESKEKTTTPGKSPQNDEKNTSQSGKKPMKASRIVIIYEDNSFTEHLPGGE